MNKYLFFLVITIASVAYSEVNVDPEPPKPSPNITTTHAPDTTTVPTTTPKPAPTPKPTPTSTTEKPTSTTEKPTSTTEKPTSTTKKPTSTTEKPTSTTKKPTSTTEKPTTTSTTTTIAPTTAKPTPPTPIPDPTMGNWSVNYPTTNRSCILMDAALQIEILHPKTNRTTKINVPINATAIGNCSTANQTISLKWQDTNVGNDSLYFEFSKLVNESKFDLMEINFAMSIGQNVTTLYHKKAEFSTPLENSYRCNKVQTFNLTDDKNVTNGYLHISHLQLQAYKNSTSRAFDSAKDCDSSLTPDVVPIVVGCVLAFLVVAVLVAYLVGRRRCQARGYLSM